MKHRMFIISGVVYTGEVSDQVKKNRTGFVKDITVFIAIFLSQIFEDISKVIMTMK